MIVVQIRKTSEDKTILSVEVREDRVAQCGTIKVGNTVNEDDWNKSNQENDLSAEQKGIF